MLEKLINYLYVNFKHQERQFQVFLWVLVY